MTDKDLIKKLNSLKSLKPDDSFKKSNRDILLSQISNSGARDLSSWQSFSINFTSFMKAISQPAYALGIFLFVILSGSLFSHQIFSGAKPNDSLYIARIVSEKARLNTVMNPSDRNKLAVRFALEHAQDISSVLADPNFNTEANQDQVARLNESFNREIDSARSMISYLSPEKKVSPVSEASSTEASEDVFQIAGSEKDEQGLQLFEANESIATPLVETTSIELEEVEEEAATSSDLTGSILDEAKQFSENKDYQKASEKLREASELIK